MSSDYLRLDLTEAQCAAISAHTPYRFHTVPVPVPVPATANDPVHLTDRDDGTTEPAPTGRHPLLLLEPYLPLPLTTSPPLLLTPQRPTDVPRIVDTLTDPAVGLQLIGPPWPFTGADAHSWGELLRVQAEEVFRELKARTELAQVTTEEPLEGGIGGAAPAGTRRWPIPAPKMHALRRADTGDWAGDFGVTRWQFDDVADPAERKRLIDENEAKDTFDPTVIWTYGFYLHPELHGKGLMAQVLASMLTTYFDGYLGANEVRGAAYASNPASLKTQERCGFVRFGSFMEDVSEGRGGGQKEVIALRRIRPHSQ